MAEANSSRGSVELRTAAYLTNLPPEPAPERPRPGASAAIDTEGLWSLATSPVGRIAAIGCVILALFATGIASSKDYAHMSIADWVMFFAGDDSRLDAPVDPALEASASLSETEQENDWDEEQDSLEE